MVGDRCSLEGASDARSRLGLAVELQAEGRPLSLARSPAMLTYVPATLALWLAFDLLVVLWLGSRRLPASD
jgi:hypothetical protein